MSALGLLASIETLVVVTGTNGKSTTAHLLERILAGTGADPIRNRDGANLVGGIEDVLRAAGDPGARPVVLEVDEGTLPKVIPPARPRVFVLTNLFRDQLDRYGEVDAVAATVRDALAALPPDAVVVANADDATVAALALDAGRATVFFGLDVSPPRDPGGHADAVLCPRCGALLAFAACWVSHLGHWACDTCGFARPSPQITTSRLVLDGCRGLTMDVGGVVQSALVGVHGAYNLLGAVAAASALGIATGRAAALAAAAGPSMPARSEWITWGEHRVFLGLVKNPAGFDAMSSAIAAEPGAKHVLFLLNDRRNDGGDVSWIWDCELERFAGDRVSAGGGRAEAMRLRLKYAGIRPRSVAHDHGAAFAGALAACPPDEPLYVLLNYTAMLDLFDVIGKPLVPV